MADIKNEIHIRIQQRNGRKSITYAEGLSALNIDNNSEFLNKLVKLFRKQFNCSVTIKDNQIIQLSGDQRTNIKNFLISGNLFKEENIKLHGF